MTKCNFLDDYSEGCHPEILVALTETNSSQQTAYGNDEYTAAARRLVGERCGDPTLPVWFVSGGTLANLIICASVLRPHEAVISASTGHMATRETGAIEATGHKIISCASDDGKLTPAHINDAVAANSHVPHMARPRLVYVSNATEVGTVYSRDELADLRAACDAHGLLLLLDGARLGVALDSSQAGGLTLADIAGLTDVFWIGGTKVGTLFGEAIVMPNRDLAVDFEFHLKQRGALLAKGRALGVQFGALFGDGLFERASAHANRLAGVLSDGLTGAGHELSATTESNQVFAILPNKVIEHLEQHYGFYVWKPVDDGRSVVRLVTSWATDPARVDEFIQRASEATQSNS